MLLVVQLFLQILLVLILGTAYLITILENHRKLLKSKVENNALGNYVKIVKDFVQGVIDNVVPQRRNTLYSRKGNIIKPQPESMVLNRLF